jgi:SAM-dependent methyltransferase
VDTDYWEEVGEAYEETIFDSASEDLSGVIRDRLDQYADRNAIATDFGCGVGHYLPLLARRFRRVHGVDGTESFLVWARERCSGLDNVTVQRANLAAARTRIEVRKARFAVCANVLISDDGALRRGILRCVHRHVVRGGFAMFLLPSLESALFANQRLVEWNRRLGYDEGDALSSGIPPTRSGARDLLQSLIRIGGVPTKHYLREEATVFLEDGGFRVVSVDKVEYDWDTEFDSPPRWMGRPGPWDWLIVAKRV